MDIQKYDLYNPLDAALSGRDEAGQDEIFNRFAALPDGFREHLVSPETAQRIADWEQGGLFPANYRTAVAKTVMLAALGEVQLEALATLFMRIGLPQPQAGEVAANVRGLVEPYLTAPELEVLEVDLDPEAGEPEELREVPPLTATAPSAPNVPVAEPESTGPIPDITKESAVPQQAVLNPTSRNIIDLRKQQEEKST